MEKAKPLNNPFISTGNESFINNHYIQVVDALFQGYNRNNMSWFIIGLFVGAPAGVWVYNKTMERTGNNTQTAVIAGVVVGLIAFLVAASLFSLAD